MNDDPAMPIESPKEPKADAVAVLDAFCQNLATCYASVAARITPESSSLIDEVTAQVFEEMLSVVTRGKKGVEDGTYENFPRSLQLLEERLGKIEVGKDTQSYVYHDAMHRLLNAFPMLSNLEYKLGNTLRDYGIGMVDVEPYCNYRERLDDTTRMFATTSQEPEPPRQTIKRIAGALGLTAAVLLGGIAGYRMQHEPTNVRKSSQREAAQSAKLQPVRDKGREFVKTLKWPSAEESEETRKLLNNLLEAKILSSEDTKVIKNYIEYINAMDEIKSPIVREQMQQNVLFTLTGIVLVLSVSAIVNGRGKEKQSERDFDKLGQLRSAIDKVALLTLKRCMAQLPDDHAPTAPAP